MEKRLTTLVSRDIKRPRKGLRIAMVAGPLEAVPPPRYGGTERVVAGLITELARRGHELTLFASGDSTVPVRLVPTSPEALRPTGQLAQEWPYAVMTVLEVARHADEFDLIHSHLEWPGLILPSATNVPVVLTFHGRLDYPWSSRALAFVQRGLVAISNAQAASHPEVEWEGIVHNGLDLRQAPFERRRSDALCFVGRISPEKGAADAIEIAQRAGRPLRVAAKAGATATEKEYFESVFKPAMKGADVELLGELAAPERDQLMADSYATLMPGSWPEPFGLVAIESLACGTPVICRRVGALPEIIREGKDGFFGDDVAAMAFRVGQVDTLDRSEMRAWVLDRFSARRMADGYEAVYDRMLSTRREEETS